MRLAVCICWFLLPLPVFSAVSISEIAWMGSVDSVNHEWIELHNDGDEVDVTGWILNDGMNLSIELSGIIPAQSYVVLERTSEASAPSEAFLIYTGALVNTGATLKLVRGDGSLVDQVSGGENWENIGGDNETKETAQYTASGWVTAPATPGEGALYEDIKEESAEPTSSQEGESSSETESVRSASRSKSGSGESIQLVDRGVTLKLAVDAQGLGYVNQPIKFLVTPSGVGDTVTNSLQYRWNFGDGNGATFKETEHAFSYPGTYVVTVHGQYKKQEQVARHEITILPVVMSLTTNKFGDVQINNDSPYEIDISGYRLRGKEVFVFPPYSVMLPDQTITIPAKRIGGSEEAMIALYDNEGVIVSSIFPSAYQESSQNHELTSSVSTVSTKQPLITDQNHVQSSETVAGQTFTFVDTENEPEQDTAIEVKTVQLDSPYVATVKEANFVLDDRLTYLALVVIMMLGVIGLYATPRRNDTQ